MAATVYFVSEDGSEHELGSVGEYSIGRGPLLKVLCFVLLYTALCVCVWLLGN